MAAVRPYHEWNAEQVALAIDAKEAGDKVEGDASSSDMVGKGGGKGWGKDGGKDKALTRQQPIGVGSAYPVHRSPREARVCRRHMQPHDMCHRNVTHPARCNPNMTAHPRRGVRYVLCEGKKMPSGWLNKCVALVAAVVGEDASPVNGHIQ